MSKLIFTFANGLLEVSGGSRTEQFMATDYKAKTWSNGEWDGVIIFPTLGSDVPYSTGTFTTKKITEYSLVIGGVTTNPTTAESFVTLFNKAAGASVGFNTKYPEHILSDLLTLDTSIPRQLTTVAKAGYLTISSPDSNGGVIYIGGSDVDNTSYQLAAGKDVFMELQDLSTLYAHASAPTDYLSILGAYKD